MKPFSPIFLLLAVAVGAHAAQITTVAGTGEKGFSGDGGPAANAQLNNPFGLTRGPDGALYFCDTDNHRIRKITRGGIISTVAGSDVRGYSGDGGPALEAALNEPYEVRFDTAGNLYFVERLNHLVRRVDARTQQITTVAGNGNAGFAGDDGPAGQAQFNQPHSLIFDRADQLYICDVLNHRVRKIDRQTGVIHTIAGTGDKKALPARGMIEGTALSGPRALDIDRDGKLWLALREGNALLSLDLAAGTFEHRAGTGKAGFTGNGGPAKNATLSGPKGVSVAPDGNVYFADTESHSVRMLNLADDTLQLIAGTGTRGDGPDGDPLQCALARPHGIFVDTDGAIYIGDSEAHRIRVIR